jgi:probable F420-dependent oxidoreductase
MKIGLHLATGEPHHGVIPRYQSVRADALRAEGEGFDSVWIMDHLLFEEPGLPRRGVWEAWSFLAAIAEATSRVELGTLVLCVPFRNPALLAKMADAVEEVSGGRLILGLGAGWREPEFIAFGYPFDHLASRLDEAVRIIAPLLRSGEVDFRGSFYQASNCVSLPRGPRPQGPPILIGATRPRLLRLTAEVADAWNTCWLGRADELPAHLSRINEACAAVDRDPASLQVTVGQLVTFPGLAPDYEIAGGMERNLFTGPDELAAEWSAFAEQGVAHIIVWANPGTPRSRDLVSAALAAYRQGAGR